MKCFNIKNLLKLKNKENMEEVTFWYTFMALNVKHPEADKLARVLAGKTGETITQAVINALKERLMREEGRRMPISLKDELIEISRRCSMLPDLDKRSPEQILDYDQHGLPR